MCTVSVITVSDGFRVVCSRDELRTRAAARVPEVFEVDEGVEAAWPVDGSSGGTWVAVNSAGVVSCVLNVNVGVGAGNGAGEAERAGVVSRGVLIPNVARFVRAADAAAAIETLPLRRLAPFRFLAIEGARHGTRTGARVVSVRWDGRGVEWSQHEAPACFVSSGLGDELVRPRLELFRETVEGTATVALQDAFHRHRWPDRPEVSVRMSRADARTVSITTLEVGCGDVGAGGGEGGAGVGAGAVVSVGAARLRYEEVGE